MPCRVYKYPWKSTVTSVLGHFKLLKCKTGRDKAELEVPIQNLLCANRFFRSEVKVYCISVSHGISAVTEVVHSRDRSRSSPEGEARFCPYRKEIQELYRKYHIYIESGSQKFKEDGAENCDWINGQKGAVPRDKRSPIFTPFFFLLGGPTWKIYLSKRHHPQSLHSYTY